LADSALATPRAGFGDQDAYPTLIEKAAVLVEHLARNHPLPDGNKRCAFLAVERFLAANGRPIRDPAPEPTFRWWRRSRPVKRRPTKSLDG
jgi:death-on-curing protein